MVAKTFLDVDYTSEKEKMQIGGLENDLCIMDYIFITIYCMGNLCSNNYIGKFKKYREVKKTKKGLNFILSNLIDY